MKKDKKVTVFESDEISALLGNPPNWASRWGLTAIFAFTVIAFIFLYFIEYPETVVIDATITTSNPVIPIYSRSSGEIDTILVQNLQRVKKQQVIAVIGSRAHYHDIMYLERLLEELHQNDFFDFAVDELPENLQLGTIQGEFDAFTKALREFQFYYKNSQAERHIRSLADIVVELENGNDLIREQLTTQREECEIFYTNLKRGESLLATGAISQVEYESYELDYLNCKRQVLENERLIHDNKKSILTTVDEKYRIREKENLMLVRDLEALRKQVKDIKLLIEVWKHDYQIRTPIDGYISFTEFYSAEQFVNEGDRVFSVAPLLADSNNLIIRAHLPFKQSGDIDVGTEANIRLLAFPYKEFGTLNGQVSSIGKVPTKEGYPIELVMLDGLITTYGVEVELMQEMKGSVKLFTKKRKLVARIFDNILSAFKNP